MSIIMQYSPIFFTFFIVISLSLIYQTSGAPAVATWYGTANGDGSDGGACGYGNAIGHVPYSSMVSAGGPSIFKAGQGCGTCYQVKCTANKACSGRSVIIVITDECPGCPEGFHFDLSGKAFGALAKPGQANVLRSAGKIQVDFRRVQCIYPQLKITFVMDRGSNPFFLAFLAKFVSGSGDLKSVEVKQAGSQSWLRMQRSSGAIWKLNSGSPIRGPISVRLTQSRPAKTIVAVNVIPRGWQAGQSFKSNVNF